MTMGLLYKLDNMVKCVCYMSLGSNGLFVTNAALKGSHYRMDIISNVGHRRLDSVGPLVLCMLMCNGWGIGIILQVPQDSTSPIEKGVISRVDHI
jgi:hypothetical protein